MTTRVAITDTWVQIAATKSAIILQAEDFAQVYVGSSAPAASDMGFVIRRANANNGLLQIENLTALGGNVYVRGQGGVRYRTN